MTTNIIKMYVQPYPRWMGLSYILKKTRAFLDISPVYIHLSFFFFCLLAMHGQAAKAGNTMSKSWVRSLNSKEWCFKENKGQLAKSASDVKFYGNSGGAHVYCKPGCISFVFIKEQTGNSANISEATGLSPAAASPDKFGGSGMRWQKNEIPNRTKIATTHRVDLVLSGANPGAEITATDEQEYYENFYLANTPDAGVTNVHTYKTITYNDIYKHIDLVLHVRENGLKYEFIVYPGGKVKDIRLNWKGLQSMALMKNGSIVYTFAKNKRCPAFLKMIETKPFSYQDSTSVTSIFQKKHDVISFKVSKYNHTKNLVIDPELSWATYFAESYSDSFRSKAESCITHDADGNVLITGNTSSASGVASPGASDTSYNNGNDAFLAKFSPSGNKLWATYYGGGNTNEGWCIAADVSGNIFIGGNTDSYNGISSQDAYQVAYGGNGDAFIAKFSASGIRLWSTYFGGSDHDGGYSLATDPFGNIFMTGYTLSLSGIANSNSYQPNFGGGGYYGDAFLVKFSSTGSRLWSTYFGGNKDDYGFGISTDVLGNVIISGMTASDSGIASLGAFQSNYGGGFWDVYIAKFLPTGEMVWSTYFGGNNYEIAGSEVATDVSGNIFVVGSTASDSGIATPGAFHVNLGGGLDAFLVKFSSTGKRLWSTYFGGSGLEIAQGISIDPFGNAYITGWTSSDSNIASVGTQSVLHGTQDAFLAKFSSFGKRLWSSYYGGNADDYGFNITTDNFSNAYIIGATSSSSGIATSGAYQTNISLNSFKSLNYFIAKFSFKVSNDAGIYKAVPDTMCTSSQAIPLTFRNYGSNLLTSATVGWAVNGKPQPPFQWTGSLLPDSSIVITPGSYNFTEGITSVVAWTYNPNNVKDTVPENDTAHLIFIATKPIAKWQSLFLGEGEQIFKALDSTYPIQNYQWGFGDGNSGMGNTIRHIYQDNNIYKVQLTIANKFGCINKYDSTIESIKHIDISIYPNPFSTKAYIKLKLADPAEVSISVTDAIGKEIFILPPQKLLPGEYNETWDATARKTAPGMYIATIKVGDQIFIKKIIQLDSGSNSK